jgi:hypothetical protein
MSSVTYPAQLGPALVAAINGGDLDAVVALYEAAAVIELPDGSAAWGMREIRGFYGRLRPEGRSALMTGDAQHPLCQTPVRHEAEVNLCSE